MAFIQWILSAVCVISAVLFYFWEDMPSEIHNWCDSMAEASAENRAAFTAMNKSAFILGYTGESGKALVKELVDSKIFSRLVLIGRREVKYEGDDFKDVEQRLVDFEKIEEHGDAFSGIDVGFCCLGTTRGKAGKDGFYRVDHDYVMNSAKVAKDAGCSEFHLVSSQGANNNSMLLYPKTKGEVEEELKEMKFNKLFIYRPAVLMCEREESRPMEHCFRTLMKPMAKAFPTFITTPTTTLAKAMVNVAVAPESQDSLTFDNKAIHKLSGELGGKKKKKEQDAATNPE